MLPADTAAVTAADPSARAGAAPLFVADVASDGRPALRWIGHGCIVLPDGCAVETLALFVNRVVEIERPAAPASPAETKATLADATFDVDAPTHRVEAGAVAGDLGGVEGLFRQVRAAAVALAKLAPEVGHTYEAISASGRACGALHAIIKDQEERLDALRRSGAAGDGVREAVPAELRRLSEAAFKGDLRLSPFKTNLLSDSPKGGDVKLFDVRGWGFYTGKGHGALGLSETEARAKQDANADFAAAAWNYARTRISAEDRARGAQGREDR